MVKTILLSVVRDTKGCVTWLRQYQWGSSPQPKRSENYRDERCSTHLTPAASLHHLSLPLHHAHGRAWTYKEQKKGKFSMRWQENIFFNSFLFSYESFSLRYRYTSNTTFSPGVLQIREMSVNWEEYSNHQETVTNLEERPVIKNIYVGPDSQVYRVWQIKHGRNMIATVKRSAECQYEDGCNFYTMTQTKIAYPWEIRGEAITWLSVRMENHIKLCVHLPGNG